VPLHEGHRQAGQLPLLDGIDGLGWMADILGGAGLDLDKDDRAAVEGHEIEFARRKPAAAGEDLIAQPLEESGRLMLATLAKRLRGKDTPQPARKQGGETHWDKIRSSKLEILNEFKCKMTKAQNAF
jgi:hypothetical protein